MVSTLAINDQKRVNLNIISNSELDDIKNTQNCQTPAQFSVKLIQRLFSKEELVGRQLPISYENVKICQNSNDCLDEARINYIKWIVGKYFDKFDLIWSECRLAINKFIEFDLNLNSKYKKNDDEIIN